MCKSENTTFTTDVLKIVSGTTIAQLILLLSTPIITRLYGPEAFGLLGIFTSITTVLGVIVCLSLNYAILLPKSDTEAVNLLILSILSATLISILTTPFVILGREVIAKLLGAPEISPYLLLIPPFVFTSGVFLALNSWNSRTKHYGRLSVAQITQSFVTTSTRLGVGFTGYATGGSLIVTQVIGVLVSSCILAGLIWRDDRKLLCGSVSWKGMIDGLKRYKKFPLMDTGSRFINAVSWQLPVFLLTAYFSPEISGFYVLGFMVFQIPMNFIGDAISKVFLQRAAIANLEGNLAPLVENFFYILVMIGMYPIFAVTIIGVELFSLIFGAVWAQAGLYAQIFGLWAFIWFLATPIGMLYNVLEKQEFGVFVYTLNFITRLISLSIGAYLKSPILSLILFSVSGIFVYGYFNIYLLTISNVNIKVMLKRILFNLKIICPFALILIILKFICNNDLFIVIAAALLGVTYYIYIIKTDLEVKALISNFNLRL